MSEVKRISVFIHGPNKKIDMVEASHLDEALAKNESSREDVRTLNLIINSTANQRDALQLKLNEADQKIDDLKKALAGMLFAFDDGVGKDWSEDLLDFARSVTPAVEFKAAQ